MSKVPPTVASLVERFATHVAAQDDAVWRLADARLGNKHHKQYLSAWRTLIAAYGDAGRDALASLLQDERKVVRTTAAVFLLRHRTADAIEVLEKEARTGDFASELALKSWRQGTWTIDP